MEFDSLVPLPRAKYFPQHHTMQHAAADEYTRICWAGSWPIEFSLGPVVSSDYTFQPTLTLIIHDKQ